MRVTALACAAACISAVDVGLRDQPIAATQVLYLDGQWSLQDDQSNTIVGQVPGDLMTDLEAAGLIGDPLYDLNWLEQSSVVWGRRWTYSTTFALSSDDLSGLSQGSQDVLLMFDGIKMGARILVNKVQVASVWDQFVRYNVSLGTWVRSGNVSLGTTNELAITFDQSVDTEAEARYMACSGGWDWAAYSNTYAPSPSGRSNTYSRGIWRSVYMAWVPATAAAITYVVPQVFYTGPYPTQPLVAGQFSPFHVVVTAHLWSIAPVTGSLTVSGAWGASTGPVPLALQPGDNVAVVNLTATASQVQLWWPNGAGPQPLYNLTTLFAPASASLPVAFVQRIGFRTIYLATGNDTDPGYIAANASADGTSDSGMFFRVNGAPLFARGANMIPMDELEGRYSSAAHTALLLSAQAAGFNMLRVWGGGVFLPQVFYDSCDSLGLMLYHDLQYAQGGHSPKVTATQEEEYRHNIRRLAAHPSIAIYDGCNECHVILNTSTGIYATFTLTTVVEEDRSRVVWPSCPSNGWVAGVNRLTALPNGSPLGLLPAAKPPASSKQGAVIGRDGWVQTQPEGAVGWGTAIETHGPYQHGGGMPAVNGNPTQQYFDPGMPISIASTTISVGYPNIFGSEFGCSVYSSFYSMSPTLAPEHWGLHGGSPPDNCSGTNCQGANVMAQRNYPCDSLIRSYWGDDGSFDQVGKGIFARHLWLCMVSQALNVHSSIMSRRATNTYGVIVWQFNEIWPTGGWGSVEYGTVGHTPGQVLGGRWKPLHHWYEAGLMRDQLAGCGMARDGPAGVVQCYARHDGITPFQGTAQVSAVGLSTGQETLLASVPMDLPGGAGQMSWFKLPSTPDVHHTVLRAEVVDGTGAVVSSNIIALTNPGNLTLLAANVTASIAPTPTPDGTVAINVTNAGPGTALWVTLSSLAQGRFLPNAFLLSPYGPQGGVQQVTFIPVPGVPVDMPTLQASTIVEHANMYAMGNWDGVGVL